MISNGVEPQQPCRPDWVILRGHSCRWSTYSELSPSLPSSTPPGCSLEKCGPSGAALKRYWTAGGSWNKPRRILLSPDRPADLTTRSFPLPFGSPPPPFKQGLRRPICYACILGIGYMSILEAGGCVNVQQPLPAHDATSEWLCGQQTTQYSDMDLRAASSN